MIFQSILTSPLIINIRRLTRRIGLNLFISKLINGEEYEDQFGNELLKHIDQSETVWDVGANVGLYSVQFAQKTGSDGKVVAFEPVLSCYEEICQHCINLPQILPNNIAMGSEDGTAVMVLEDDPLAATHRVDVDSSSNPGERGVQVTIRSAESFITENPDLFPNVIKIDVEGHEGAVFDGMKSILGDKRLHCIGVEIHFGILNNRGESGRPKEIEALLRENGFKIHWTDLSHIVGVRN